MASSRGTKRLINKWGKEVTIDATFWVTADAKVGDKSIKLHDPVGLLPGAEFKYEADGVVHTIKIRSAGPITELESPLTVDIPKDTLLTIHSVSRALFVAPGRTITRDSVEFSRRIRVPNDLVVSFGSILTFDMSKYFVSGYQEGDSSISLGLKLANVTIDWYAKEDLPDQSIDEGDVVNWGSDPEPRDWPKYQSLILKGKDILAYQEQLSVYSRLEEVGYLPNLNRMYVVPIWLPIKIGDILEAEGETLRVIGRDPTRIRHMQALYVDFAEGVIHDE